MKGSRGGQVTLSVTRIFLISSPGSPKNQCTNFPGTTYKLPSNYVQTSRNSGKSVRMYKLTEISGSMYVYVQTYWAYKLTLTCTKIQRNMKKYKEMKKYNEKIIAPPGHVLITKRDRIMERILHNQICGQRIILITFPLAMKWMERAKSKHSLNKKSKAEILRFCTNP